MGWGGVCGGVCGWWWGLGWKRRKEKAGRYKLIMVNKLYITFRLIDWVQTVSRTCSLPCNVVTHRTTKDIWLYTVSSWYMQCYRMDNSYTCLWYSEISWHGLVLLFWLFIFIRILQKNKLTFSYRRKIINIYNMLSKFSGTNLRIRLSLTFSVWSDRRWVHSKTDRNRYFLIRSRIYTSSLFYTPYTCTMGIG